MDTVMPTSQDYSDGKVTPILFANINPAALPRRCKDLNGYPGWCHAIGFGIWENRMIALAVFEYERGTLTTVPAEWITLDPVKEPT